MDVKSYLDFLADPFGGEGRLITDEPDIRVWVRWKNGVLEQASVINSDPILADTARERSDNAGKRWGDGQVVGRIPLDLYFSSGMSEANLQGDTKWLKRFWNSSDHAKLRTFEGKI